MKASLIAVCLLMMAASVALGQEATTRPAGGNEGGPLHFGMRGRMHDRSITTRPSSPEEWDEAMAFLDKNSPHRAEMLRELNLPENSSLRMSIIKKFRNYRIVADRFPEMAALTVKRYQLEDDIFALTVDGRKNPSPENLESIRLQVHEKAAELVKLGIDEREVRIKKMEELLAEEKGTLSRDQGQIDKLTEDRTAKIMDRITRVPRAEGTQAPTPVDPHVDAGQNRGDSLVAAADDLSELMGLMDLGSDDLGQ